MRKVTYWHKPRQEQSVLAERRNQHLLPLLRLPKQQQKKQSVSVSLVFLLLLKELGLEGSRQFARLLHTDWNLPRFATKPPYLITDHAPPSRAEYKHRRCKTMPCNSTHKRI